MAFFFFFFRGYPYHDQITKLVQRAKSVQARCWGEEKSAASNCPMTGFAVAVGFKCASLFRQSVLIFDVCAVGSNSTMSMRRDAHQTPNVTHGA